MRAPAYVAFDVIWLNGVDPRALPLTDRRRHLRNILPKRSAIISEALSVTGRGHKLLDLMCAHDLEGVVTGPQTRSSIGRVWQGTRAPQPGNKAAPPAYPPGLR